MRYRIALVGNVANNFGREAAMLARAGQVDVTLFLDEVEANSLTDGLESDSPVRSQEASFDVFFMPRYRLADLVALLVPLMGPHLLRRRLRALVRALNSYDVAVFSGTAIPLLIALRTPTCIRPTGSDLTVYPIATLSEDRALGPEAWRGRYFRRSLAVLVRKALFRRAYRKATAVSCPPHSPFTSALTALRISPGVLVPQVPLAVPMEVFRPLDLTVEDIAMLSDLGLTSMSFLVFLPSRVLLRNSALHSRTGQYKGSDKALQGFADFLSNLSPSERSEAYLLVPARRDDAGDYRHFVHLANCLGIQDRIMWLRGQREGGLTRAEMIPIFSVVDATLDNFGFGWFGSVFLEALSCGSPVVSHVGASAGRLAPEGPIRNARTPQQISDALLSIYRGREKRQVMSIEARHWIETYHSETTICQGYLELCYAVSSRAVSAR